MLGRAAGSLAAGVSTGGWTPLPPIVDGGGGAGEGAAMGCSSSMLGRQPKTGCGGSALTR